VSPLKTRAQSNNVKPTILIATTARWFPATRLAIALANAGCVVDAVCPSRHTLGKTKAVRRTYAYRALTPVRSFADAIAAAEPDFIIPGDDLATRHLHELYKRECDNGTVGAQVCALIERSLGAAESFEIVYARSAFIQMAQAEGIRAPKTDVIANTSDLRNWIARSGLPAVLKANGTSGGDGVKMVKTAEEAERAFRKLQAPPLVARAVKRALIDQDPTLVASSFLRRQSVVNAQAFVAGHEATSTMACWNGEVLASLHFEVLQKISATGHATVLRRIDHPEMSAATEKIARRLKLSGIHGLDFMLEANTGNAYLIEINPRTTQVGHLALGPRRDLPAALYAALAGHNATASPIVTDKDTIALFPHEWMRDPASEFLLSGYHDVPWEETELVRECLPGGSNQSDRRQQIVGRPLSRTGHPSQFKTPSLYNLPKP
jgi:carbamoyl-phosphate synthase L subunit-like protein